MATDDRMRRAIPMHQETDHAKDCQTKRPFYRLKLFVAGEELNSHQARAILNEICQQYLSDCCQLEIVDVYTDYHAAIDYGVLIVPTLIIEEPPPIRTIVGTLSAKEKVLAALGLTARKGEQ